MNTDLRDRAVLPVLIPLAAIVVTEIVVFSMSRVLLVTGKNPAVIVALGAALAILVGAAMVAASPRMRASTIAGLLVLGLIVSVAAGAWAMTQKPFYEKEAEANRPELDVAAADLAFDTETLELAPAGTVIAFNNADTQPHNIAVYESEDNLNTALFKGETIAGGQSITYEVGTLEVGKWYFQCDVHPNMNGDAIVEEGAGGAAHEGAH